MDSKRIHHLCLLSLGPGGGLHRHKQVAQPGHRKHGDTGSHDKVANSGWRQRFCASLFLHVDDYLADGIPWIKKCGSPSNSPCAVLNTNHVIRVTW